MSALGGILTFGGGPVDREQLSALGAHLERLGPDGGRDVIAGSIGMTYRAFHTNAESRREHQPHWHGHQAMLCFDGRLDNREELRRELRDDLRGGDTDVAIAMAAFLRWHRDGIAKLVGDFALAVWLARDCVGTRTLYYRLDNDRVIWSTDLGALLDVSGVSIEVNDEYVAGFLTRGPEPGLTPYVGVHAVKPAHVLRIEDDGFLSEQRFWALDPYKEILYRTDAEYEEHFRTLFRDAVRERLRSDRPVFAELSGGLDSSSIVCMADAILHTHAVAAPSLETVSYVFDASPSSDERAWISLVESRRNRVGCHILERTHPYLLPPRDRKFIRSVSFGLVSASYPEALAAAMRKADARVLLSGQGGDHILQSSRATLPPLADAFRACRFRELHAQLAEWSAVLKRPYLHLLWNGAIIPNLPVGLQVQLRRADVEPLPRWFMPGFVKRCGLRRRWVADAARLPFDRPSIRHRVAAFQSASRTIGTLDLYELKGIALTYPYLHRPLVEFTHAIPFGQLVRPKQTRSVVRRALRSMLPPEIVERHSKGNPAEVIFRAMNRDRERLRTLFGAARTADRGYINKEIILGAIDSAAAGSERQVGSLLNALTLELWLRSLEASGEEPEAVAPSRSGSMHLDAERQSLRSNFAHAIR